jgi:hypothetical protein
MVVNSMITDLEEGAQVKVGQPVEVKGIAWDGGYGIADVVVSIDDGRSWASASLGRDLGRFAWRQWSFSLTPARPGTLTIKVRARNNAGQTQVDKLLFNGAGYHNNVVQALSLTAV